MTTSANILSTLSTVFTAFGDASEARDTFAPYMAQAYEVEDGYQLDVECSDGRVMFGIAYGTLDATAVTNSGELMFAEFAGFREPGCFRLVA